MIIGYEKTVSKICHDLQFITVFIWQAFLSSKLSCIDSDLRRATSFNHQVLDLHISTSGHIAVVGRRFTCQLLKSRGWHIGNISQSINSDKVFEEGHRLWKNSTKEAEVPSLLCDQANWGIWFTEFRSMRSSYSETGGLVLTPDFGKSDVI